VVEAFDGFVPIVAPGAWVHPSAVLIGQVEVADGASVWPTCVLRGDMGPIRVGRDSNLQDGTICHDTTDRSQTVVGERVTIGHRALLHGCAIEDDCLVGMGSIVMDNAVVGAGSFVAAGSLVTPGTVIPPGSFVRGAPARVIRPVSERDIESIAYSWRHYRDTMRKWLERGG
jgi:carbonic anhydrase/acetyltransferase-like protein (isoleucine patch superfamily)